MRLDHLLSRERSEARERGAEPEVEERKREGIGRGTSAEARERAAKSREPDRGARANRREPAQGLAESFFTISFSGIADAP